MWPCGTGLPSRSHMPKAPVPVPAEASRLRQILPQPMLHLRAFAGGFALLRSCEGKADDGSRTRDLELGKLALYQLSYVREQAQF